MVPVIIVEPRIVAAWLSGFCNGKRDNALIDTQLPGKSEDEENFSLPVMGAIERTNGGNRADNGSLVELLHQILMSALSPRVQRDSFW